MLLIFFIPFLLISFGLKTRFATSLENDVNAYSVNIPAVRARSSLPTPRLHTVGQDSPEFSVIRPNPFTSSPLIPRTSSRVNIYQRNSRIRVTVRMSNRIAGAAVSVLLSEAYGVVIDVISHINDGVISPPGFQWTDPNGFSIAIWNSNNRDMTWSDLGLAIVATAEYMAEYGWGIGHLIIYQGSVELGRGEIRKSGTGDPGGAMPEPH